jgi:uncharacterized protein
VLCEDLADRRGLPRLTVRAGVLIPGASFLPKGNMQLSKHNISGKLRGSDSWFILNPLSRSADLLEPGKAQEVARGEVSDPSEFIGRGYLIEPDEEARLYRTAYLDFLKRRDAGEIQLFFVPWYTCNFACPYCYQEGYAPDSKRLSPDVTDAFFRYAARQFSGRRAYVTLFGGEPLLAGRHAHEAVAHFLGAAGRAGLETAVVTNGYTLAEYVELLRASAIREVQVTLDGVGETHDRRRPLKGGQPTFDRIVSGIDAALESRLPVNLRVVLDRQNIDALPELARFAVERGWTARPGFKTQLGRNYELHTCQADPRNLFSRVELYEKIYRQIAENPQILDFHRPAFSLARFLWENGELPDPLFDSCPGCKGEWAFDTSGRIYSCTATVGKSGEELGTFHPAVTRNEQRIAEWEERDVTAIPECRDCHLQLACGGGCGAVARNRTGRLHAPDCRPVRELMEMGISLYMGQGEAR